MKIIFLIFCVFTEIINFNKSEDFKFNHFKSSQKIISPVENKNKKVENNKININSGENIKLREH